MIKSGTKLRVMYWWYTDRGLHPVFDISSDFAVFCIIVFVFRSCPVISRKLADFELQTRSPFERSF